MNALTRRRRRLLILLLVLLSQVLFLWQAHHRHQQLRELRTLERQIENRPATPSGGPAGSRE